MQFVKDCNILVSVIIELFCMNKKAKGLQILSQEVHVKWVKPKIDIRDYANYLKDFSPKFTFFRIS